MLAPLGRLRRIVLTHFHADHAGSAAELATDGVQVLAHRADAPVIRGERPGPPPSFTPAERELHARVAAGLPPAPPARVDVELGQGYRLDVGGKALVLSVPGHTDGSIALHLPADGVLFTGDLIAEWNGDIVQGRSMWTPRRQRARRAGWPHCRMWTSPVSGTASRCSGGPAIDCDRCVRDDVAIRQRR